MDKLNLKTWIEEDFKELMNVDVIVEFVDDVSKRSLEIREQDEIKWNSAYEADHFVGTFLPNTSKHCAYILVEDNREYGMMLETCLHEEKHAIDYYMFLNTVFQGNQELMINSPLYGTFQIFSEYEAKKFGWFNFLNCIEYPDFTKHELEQRIFEIYTKAYYDTNGIVNKYQFLMHSIQYFGVLCAIDDYDKDFNLDSKVDKMMYIDEIRDIFNMLYKNKDLRTSEWFEKFDKTCKDYINKG